MDKQRGEQIKSFVKRAPDVAAKTLAAFLTTAAASAPEVHAQEIPGPRTYEEGRKTPSPDDYHYHAGPREMDRGLTPEQFKEIMQGLPKSAQELLDLHKQYLPENQKDVEERLKEMRSRDGGRDSDLSPEDREERAKSLSDT